MLEPVGRIGEIEHSTRYREVVQDVEQGLHAWAGEKAWESGLSRLKLQKFLAFARV